MTEQLGSRSRHRRRIAASEGHASLRLTLIRLKYPQHAKKRPESPETGMK
jgi:hypothetical protein